MLLGPSRRLVAGLIKTPSTDTIAQLGREPIEPALSPAAVSRHVINRRCRGM
jgi:hypothetical protein